MTGDADAIARVRTFDNADLERLIIDLQRSGLVDAPARRWCCRAWFTTAATNSAHLARHS